MNAIYIIYSMVCYVKLCLAGMIFLLLIFAGSCLFSLFDHSVDHRAGVDEKGQLWLCLITETIVVFIIIFFEDLLFALAGSMMLEHKFCCTDGCCPGFFEKLLCPMAFYQPIMRDDDPFGMKFGAAVK